MRVLLAISALCLLGCSGPPHAVPALSPGELPRTKWSDIERRARGSEVTFAMWAGDEQRNRYFRGPATQTLRQRYGIELRIAPFSDTVEIVNKLSIEKQAGRSTAGSIDMVWINGENFRSAHEARLLWGPFAQVLPSVSFYPDVARRQDFGTPTEDFEAPWESAQFVFAYDVSRVAQPPRTLEALRGWIQTHPGRFAYVAPPDFSGSAFIRHLLLRFGRGGNFETFDEAHYMRASAGAIAYLREIRPSLWRRGETYPPTARELDRLFANNEVDFTMNYGPAFASVRVERGEFPKTTRTFLLDTGTLANYSYLAIPFNAPNVSGAIVAINHLTSFDPLLEISRELKAPFPLEIVKLSKEQRQRVAALPRGIATLADEELSSHALQEPHAEYLIRFEQDWRTKVLRQ